eukprot:11535841-Alexandrium_andersonii.AAC.1
MHACAPAHPHRLRTYTLAADPAPNTSRCSIVFCEHGVEGFRIDCSMLWYRCMSVSRLIVSVLVVALPGIQGPRVSAPCCCR